jgi:GNAT superfamily N-acetyltransferase
MAPSKLHIRDTCKQPEDAAFILAAFDSALPHLASIGSSGQWGTQPFSESPDRVKRMDELITAAGVFEKTGKGDPVRIFVAEAPVSADDGRDLSGLSVRTADNGERFLSVAALSIHERYWPQYVSASPGLAPVLAKADAEENPIYLEVLISDFRTGASRKGAGAALTERAKQYCKARGAKALYLDCWSGNDGNLCRYYLSQGFVSVGDFCAEKEGREPWPGTLFKMAIE